MSESERRACIISSPSKRCAKKILKKMEGKKFWWVYLGEDISKVVSIDEMMRGKGQRFEAAGLLQEAAKSLWQPYIDYIGGLDLEKNSLMWWAGRLSEKNPYVSKTFLHACYIKTCVDILRKNPDESFVFFVEKRAVRRAIFKNISSENLVRVESSGEPIRGALERLNEFILQKGRFLLTNIYRVLISKHAYRIQRRVKSREPLVLVHTWVDRHSFDGKGVYHERYFGGLSSYLKKNGEHVAIVPHILSVIPYRKTIDNIARSKNVFLVPHAFLSIRDILSVFFTTLINRPKKTVFARFGGMDISEVIHEDLKNDWIEGHMASDMLFYRFVKRMKEKGLAVDTAIYPYENHAWEKILCVAMREFYPSAYLIGYQHATVRMMQLNHFFSRHESGIVPLPDRIVTNGRYPKELFIRSGYPDEKVVRGGAIRYAYLLESKIEAKRRGGNPVVLVTPSIGTFGAELIWKIFEAFEHRGECKVLIKCHPDTPFQAISGYLDISFPEHFIISDRPVAELLKESDVLLYTDSTTCIEAIAAGVPAVHVESDFSIDIDPLDFDPKIRASARSPEEIVKCVEAAVSMSEEELSKKREVWGGVVRGLFGKVDDSVYRLFLE